MAIADGNYLTMIILNFVIALALLGTPWIVHSLVGGGLSSVAQTLMTATVAAMATAPVRLASATSFGLDALASPKGFASHIGSQFMPKGRFEQSQEPS